MKYSFVSKKIICFSRYKFFLFMILQLSMSYNFYAGYLLVILMDFYLCKFKELIKIQKIKYWIWKNITYYFPFFLILILFNNKLLIIMKHFNMSVREAVKLFIQVATLLTQGHRIISCLFTKILVWSKKGLIT